MRATLAAMLALALTSVPAWGTWFSGTWEGELTIAPSLEFSSFLTLSYTWGGLKLRSASELHPVGFTWQEFGLVGAWQGIGLQADLLFGPSTMDYLYGQLILTARVAGLEVSLYTAQLSDAVLGGPAEGSAIRVAGNVGGIGFVNVLELGARIEDEEFPGITIYHSATGLSRHYVTNPMVAGAGFTGDKLTLTGLPLCCVEEVKAVFYLAKTGFSYLKVELSKIDFGGSPVLTFDIEVVFQVQTKSLVLIPRVNLGEWSCIDLYAAVVAGMAPGELSGLEVYGLGFGCELGPMSMKGLTVFDTGKYAITTEEYGSVIEAISEAVEQGHEYYPDYWELISLVVEGPACCGGNYSFLANTYFEEGSGELFGWGMTYLKLVVPLSSKVKLAGEIKVTATGLEKLALGFSLNW